MNTNFQAGQLLINFHKLKHEVTGNNLLISYALYAIYLIDVCSMT